MPSWRRMGTAPPASLGSEPGRGSGRPHAPLALGTFLLCVRERALFSCWPGNCGWGKSCFVVTGKVVLHAIAEALGTTRYKKKQLMVLNYAVSSPPTHFFFIAYVGLPSHTSVDHLVGG